MAEPSAQALDQQRCGAIERNFSDVQQHRNYRRVTARGLRRVRAEWASTVLHMRIAYSHLTTAV